MSTENIAHEKRYRDWRAQYDAMFAPENRSPQQDEQFPLTDGYSICSKAYCHNGDFYLNGSENELLDIEGKMRYAWRNLDADGEFCSLFRHRNGKHYLIFRTELYEYSVLEVESGQEMHYVPACVHPEEGQKPEEVFIWISADYDPGANLLAVTGCIWACPYSTIVLDFSCPLQPQPPEHWLDLRRIIDPNDTRFDDIEFVRWADGALVLRGSDVEDGRWKEVRVSAEQLRTALFEIKKEGRRNLPMTAHYFFGSAPADDALMNAVFSGENTVDALKVAAKQHEFLFTAKICLWNELHIALVGHPGTEPISHEPLSQAIVGVDFVDDGQVAYTLLEDLEDIVSALNEVEEGAFLGKYLQQSGPENRDTALAEFRALRDFYNKCQNFHGDDNNILVVGIYCD